LPGAATWPQRHAARQIAGSLHRLAPQLGFLQKPGAETKAARDIAALLGQLNAVSIPAVLAD
jgi:hypothetical protein